MELLLDEHPVDGTGVVDGTIEETLRRIQSEMVEPGRMIVALHCDGQELGGDEMTAAMARPASSLNRLEVFTSTAETLVVDAMSQGAVSLEASEEQRQRAARLLTEGKTTEGIDCLRDCVQTWQQVHEAVVKSVEMLGIDVDQAVINDEPLLEVISRPASTLGQIKKALVAQDHVLLADVLEYEFEDVTEQWYSVINYMKGQAEQRSQSQ